MIKSWRRVGNMRCPKCNSRLKFIYVHDFPLPTSKTRGYLPLKNKAYCQKCGVIFRISCRTYKYQTLERDGNKKRGMKLLPRRIRGRLPSLYSQDGKGGKAVAWVKFFTPDSSWKWYATEFDGKNTFFGLVDGLVKELGYFSLSELESVRGPMGLQIECDLYWQPKTLEEIAPELFKKSNDECKKKANK